MDLLRPQLPAVLKRAADVLAAHAAASSGVAVMWQRDGEVLPDFHRRVRAARDKLPPERLLLAVGERGVLSGEGVRAVELPPVMLPLLTRPARYRVCYGGRGAGRSWSFARALLVRSLERRLRVLCAREYQNSIAESVHELLASTIERLDLSRHFEVRATDILGANGSEFIFRGLHFNADALKSMEGFNVCWVEQAERVSQGSWAILLPTIREAGSEIWLTLNPDLAADPTYESFIVQPRPHSIVVKTTFRDNPWFPRVLRAEMEYLRSVDDDAYRWVWEGECRSHSNAQILKGKVTVESFEPQPHWDGPYFGLDFGFSQDPTAAVKCYVADRVLYVSHEAWGVGVDIDATPRLLDTIPEARSHVMRADCSRPETISYLASHAYPNVIAAPKWAGSVEDGVAFLRAFEAIKIHPRCVHTLEEARLYSYKTDRLSGDVLPDIVDRHNHCMDATRYALAPLIQARGSGIMAYYEAELAKDQAPTAAPTPPPSPGWSTPALVARVKAEKGTLSDLTPWHRP
jgi:phage terminase large subunit